MRGKPRKFHLCLFVVSLSIFLFSGWVVQDEVVEQVDVVNREVVVRVFDGGEPVPGLTKKDFALTENGKSVIITSCREIRRALRSTVTPSRTPASPLPATQTGQPRVFLFLLWWNEENPEWSKAWNYFLTRIFRPGDRVILSSDRHAIQFRSTKEDQAKVKNFFARMSKELKQKRLDKIRIINEMERCTRDFHEALMANSKSRIKIPEDILLNDFQNRYRGALDEYRLSRLRARPGMLTRLGTALRAVEAEKWTLLFMQNERLPLVHDQSRLMLDAPMKGQGDEIHPSTRERLRRFLRDCDLKIRMATDMSARIRDMQSLFIGAGATFHLFLSDAKTETLGSDQLRWLPVFSSWESTFRTVSRDTGGTIFDTTRLEQALKKAATRTDIHYILTYKPSEKAISRPRLRIQVARPGLKAVYARKLKAKEIRPLKISFPKMKGNTLSFELSGYLRESATAGVPTGRLHIRVSAESPGHDTLEFEKTLQPGGDVAAVSMRVNLPDPGRYLLMVEASDLVSGQSALGHITVDIAVPEPGPEMAIAPMSAELMVVLDKAATYCRKLQHAAFRFTCNEVVEERFLEKNPVRKRVEPRERQWRYDYQVVVDNGEVTEQRRLVQAEHKKVNIPGAKLETRFKAKYSVFLPVTLLGGQNRQNNRYQLVKTVRLKKRNCAIIEVTPRQPGKGPLARGKVWVDVDDGSILKIEMDPRGVAGSAALETAARKMSARLDLKAVHWYLEEHKGLRFPSSAEFSESYVFDSEVRQGRLIPIRAQSTGRAIGGLARNFRYRMVEFYRMSQRYKKYRYFEVETKVEIDATE